MDKNTSTAKKKEQEIKLAQAAMDKPQAQKPVALDSAAALYDKTSTSRAVNLPAPTQPPTPTTDWQSQLDNTMNKIMNREKFTYDLNGDALYNQYKDRFVNQGKMAMMDTMGQAAALTGGYGNSYAQAAGQQAYQNHLLGLNDMVPELYNLAYQKYNDDTNALYKQFDMLGQKEEQAYNRQQDAYGNLQSLIAATGMVPTAEQLASAGMTQEEANALKMSFAAENPDRALRAGLITDQEYFILTGIDKNAKPSGSGGWSGGDYDPDIAYTQDYLRSLGYDVKVTGINDSATEAAAAKEDEKSAKGAAEEAIYRKIKGY